MPTRHTLFAFAALGSLCAGSGCFAYAQPGLLDPGHVAPLRGGAREVTVSAAPVVDAYGEGGGVDARVEMAPTDDVGVGGEVFGGGGKAGPTEYVTTASTRGAGVAGFVRANPTASLAVLGGGAVASDFGKHDAWSARGSVAWSPWSNEVFEPYVLLGLHASAIDRGTYFVAGLHAGVGTSFTPAPNVSLHAGIVAETDFCLGVVVPVAGYADVGVSYRF